VTGGVGYLYTDRKACRWCRNSMRGYAKMLNLDELHVYGPNGLEGVCDQKGRRLQ
jgi:hypothetical protein